MCAPRSTHPYSFPERCVQVALCACHRFFAACSTFSPLGRPPADEQQGGGEYDAELANASRCVSFREQTVDLPALASFQHHWPIGRNSCQRRTIDTWSSWRSFSMFVTCAGR